MIWLYCIGIDIKRINEQVDQFSEDFMFQLTEYEFQNLKSQFATSSDFQIKNHIVIK